MNKSSEEQPNIKNEPIIEKNVQEEKIYVESTIEIENSSFDKSNNKVLFISYKNNYAILPHTTEDLEKAFSDNPEKYSSLQDIIDKEYTISLKDYKIDSSSTVYDECFNIAKNKCNYNSLKAMKFANSAKRIEGANPLIIRACNNVNEVEFYLNCLENNKLDEFNLFKIEEEK